MSRFIRNSALLLTVVAFGSSAAGVAEADCSYRGCYGGTRTVRPQPRAPQMVLPRFGFDNVQCEFGMQVVYVGYNSIAYQLGLQCDDIIVAVNGVRVYSTVDWRRELRQALFFDGRVQLQVRKCSGGLVPMVAQFTPAVPGVMPSLLAIGDPPFGAAAPQQGPAQQGGAQQGGAQQGGAQQGGAAQQETAQQGPSQQGGAVQQVDSL